MPSRARWKTSLPSRRSEWEFEHGKKLKRAQDEFDTMMGGQKRIKCMMLLKKMKNSRLQSVFATWDDWLMTIKWERMEAEKGPGALMHMAQLGARFAHLSAEEIERKLREFMKHWIKQKMLAPWATWP